VNSTAPIGPLQAERLGGGVFSKDEQGTVFSLTLVKGVLKMPLNPDIAVLLRRIETMPLATYQPGETVIAAGTKTGRLLILKKGAVTIRKNGTVIAEVTEPGAVIGELSALLNQPHTADVQKNLGSLGVSRRARRPARGRSRRTLVRCSNPGTASQPRK
jgi:Cyclic nucleotide-binding domain